MPEQILDFVIFVYFAKHFAGIPCGNHVCWYILRDNTSCTNDSILPNRYPRTNHRSTANPDIVPDRDSKSIHISISAKLWINRMSCDGNRDIRCKLDPVTYVNPIIVHQIQVKIHIDTLPDKHIGSIAEVNGGFYPTMFSYCSEHLLHQFKPLFYFTRFRMIKFIHQFLSASSVFW